MDDTYLFRCVSNAEALSKAGGTRVWYVSFEASNFADPTLDDESSIELVLHSDGAARQFVVGNNYLLNLKWAKERNHPSAEQY